MKIGNKTLTGNHIKIAKKIQKNRDLIINKTFISIDPGSTSPGWALWKLGKLVDAGEIKPKKTDNISKRLAYIHDYLESLPQADIIIVEKIGIITGRKAQSHPYLLWSLGAIAGALRCKNMIEMPPSMWQKFRNKNYTKSDREDAIVIGRACIEIAKII